MHFIEGWFGFAPDGGNGSLEVLILLFVCAALLVPQFIRRGIVGKTPVSNVVHSARAHE
jgi:hypothetical protein